MLQENKIYPQCGQNQSMMNAMKNCIMKNKSWLKQKAVCCGDSKALKQRESDAHIKFALPSLHDIKHQTFMVLL